MGGVVHRAQVGSRASDESFWNWPALDCATSGCLCEVPWLCLQASKRPKWDRDRDNPGLPEKRFSPWMKGPVAAGVLAVRCSEALPVAREDRDATHRFDFQCVNVCFAASQGASSLRILGLRRSFAAGGYLSHCQSEKSSTGCDRDVSRRKCPSPDHDVGLPRVCHFRVHPTPSPSHSASESHMAVSGSESFSPDAHHCGRLADE